MLAYNCSPSFNWRKNLDDATIAKFQRELGAMGYKFQFITLAGFHQLNFGMFELARGYRERQMAAYSELQQAEFAAEANGYTATKHQREVGTGYFDAVSMAIIGRPVVDHGDAWIDRARPVPPGSGINNSTGQERRGGATTREKNDERQTASQATRQGAGLGMSTDQQAAIRILANDLHRLNQAVMKAVEAGVSVELVRSARHHGGDGNWGDL